MSDYPLNRSLLKIILSGYWVAWTYGMKMGLRNCRLMLLGRICVHGYWRLLWCALRGRLMIMPNHPTLYHETFGIAWLLFPLYLFLPWCFIFSTPDRRLLDRWKMPEKRRDQLRCIQLDRSDAHAGATGFRKMRRVLDWRGIIVAHGEEGRTTGDANRNKTPIVRNGIAMQKISSKLTRVAHESRATILPCKVVVPGFEELPDARESQRQILGKGNERYWPVEYFFGPEYRTRHPFDLAFENERLQEAIFNA